MDMQLNNYVQLNEIFVSIEGEGIFAGTKTMFIRFSGCHLKCYWCDTNYSIPLNSGKQYTIDYVKSLIQEHMQPNIFKVNFTGGEPLLQHHPLILLANFVKNELGLRTYLETSCFDYKRFQSVLQCIDICKIEFKTLDSKVVDPSYYENLLMNELKCLDLALEDKSKITFIKIVFTDMTKSNEIQSLVEKIFNNPKIGNLQGFILQPSYGFDSPSSKKILEVYDIVSRYYKDVRVIPQMHKLLGMN